MGKRDYLGISELGQCARRVTYTHCTDLSAEFGEETKRKLEFGHVIERMRRGELRAAGRSVTRGQFAVNFGPALGHIDGTVRGEDKGDVWLWECKSTTLRAILKWMKEGLPRYYLWQVNGYMYGLSEALGKHVTHCLFEAFDRASCRWYTIPCEADPGVQKEALDRAHQLGEAIAKKELLPREFGRGSMECNNCPYNKTCWDIKDVEDIMVGADSNVTPMSAFPVLLPLAKEYSEVSRLANDYKNVREELRGKIVKAMDGVRSVAGDGWAVVRGTGSREGLDTERLKRENPDLVRKYTVRNEYDKLTVKKLGEVADGNPPAG